MGRRVIINKKSGRKGAGTDTAEIDELTYLLESGSDRIGALDFQVFHGKGFVDKLDVLIQNTMMGDHIGRSVDQPEHADNNEITGNDIIQ